MINNLLENNASNKYVVGKIGLLVDQHLRPQQLGVTMESEILIIRIFNESNEENESYFVDMKDVSNFLSEYQKLIYKSNNIKEFTPMIAFESGSVLLKTKVTKKSSTEVIDALKNLTLKNYKVDNKSKSYKKLYLSINRLIENSQKMEVYFEDENEYYNKSNPIILSNEKKFHFNILESVVDENYLSGEILGTLVDGLDDKDKGKVIIRSNSEKYTLQLSYEDLKKYTLEIGDIVIVHARYYVILETHKIDVSKKIQVIDIKKSTKPNIEEAFNFIDQESKQYWNDPFSSKYMLAINGVVSE